MARVTPDAARQGRSRRASPSRPAASIRTIAGRLLPRVTHGEPSPCPLRRLVRTGVLALRLFRRL
jgi:hypothetical protein